MSDAIAFRPLTKHDLPRLRRWLSQPHVAAWWGEADAELGKIAAHLGSPRMDCFLVTLGGRPAGYLQSYPIGAWPDDPFADQPAGSRGLDLFIGDPRLLDRGLGTAIVQAFVARLFAAGVPRVVIDPHPDNARAIRAYEKAGFIASGTVAATPWGPARLMTCARP